MEPAAGGFTSCGFPNWSAAFGSLLINASRVVVSPGAPPVIAVYTLLGVVPAAGLLSVRIALYAALASKLGRHPRPPTPNSWKSANFSLKSPADETPEKPKVDWSGRARRYPPHLRAR